MATIHSLGASALLALTVGSLPLFGAAYQGSAYEGFDYAPGTVDATYGGGTGWNASGDASSNTTTWAVGANLVATGSRAVTADSLSYSNPAYPASTGNAVLISGAGQVGRSFGQTIDDGTFYFSYLTRKTVDTLRTVNLSFFSATNERLAIGQIASNTNTRNQDGAWLAGAGANNGNFALFLANSQNNASAQTVESAFNGVYVNTVAPVSYAVDTTFLVVGKFEFNYAGGVEDRFTIYINPGDLADESALVPYLQLDHNDFGALAGFRMFAGGTAGGFNASAARFDELRFGSTFNSVTGVSVIPEPASFAALVGLVGLGLAASRRRRA